MSSDPKQIRTLTDCAIDTNNANRHTARGTSMMETSIREAGFGDSITVDREGIVISGGQRTETLVDLGMTNPIVVQSDGTRPIIHQRVDLDADDPRAIKLALFSNRVGQVNLDWDPGVLKAIQADGVALGALWTPDELAELFEQTSEEEPEASVVAYTVLVTCRDEAHQQEVLARLKDDGLDCRAKAD